ncbi:MAG: hypothetical protein LBH19_14510 [Dysgonamonadaceae bacterium]|jgi:hypothetical protein|nr:hypothetical protein [Dysgonamonadaceae bacterium]
MAIIAQDIVTEYGAYYIKSEQNQQRLRRLLLFGRETTKIARQIKTEDTVYRMATSSLSPVVQPFQKTFTPKGDLTFKPNPIPLYNIKADLLLYPDDIKNSWLAFLESENFDRRQWPLIRYIMENHLIQKIEDDMETKAYYLGVRVEPVSGTASDPEKSMNGLQYLLKNNTGINRLTMDPLEASTIYDQIEETYEQVSEVYQSKQMLICLAPKWQRAFLRDKRAQGYYQYTTPGQIDNTLDFSPAKVHALPSMIGTDDIFITPYQNLVHVTKYGANSAKFEVEKVDRSVKIYTDWYEGFGFELNEVVWTNVSAPAPAPEPAEPEED